MHTTLEILLVIEEVIHLKLLFLGVVDHTKLLSERILLTQILEQYLIGFLVTNQAFCIVFKKFFLDPKVVISYG